MKITVTADDLGLCARSTQRILETRARGCLDRAGILPNGEAFPLAVSSLHADAPLGTSVHLNLAEGRALSASERIPLLVDNRGRFRRSFIGLWLLHGLSPRQRGPLRAQIEQELGAQIHRVREALPGRPIVVDSHRHFHLQPFVFRILVRRAGAWGIEGIRIANEPFLLPPPTRQGLSCLASANLLKHVVLRTFSRWCLRALEGSALAHPDYLVGVLYSGRMSLPTVRRALRRIASRSAAANPHVELVFHPSRVSPRDVRGWDAPRRAKRFYVSKDRTSEMETLVSEEFRRCLERFEEARC